LHDQEALVVDALVDDLLFAFDALDDRIAHLGDQAFAR
jgi:hypothetical protein